MTLNDTQSLQLLLLDRLYDFLLVVCCNKISIYTVSKNDTDVAHCNFIAHQLIVVIFVRDGAKRVW